MFDIKNPNSFLGGQNVHNLIIIGLLIYIIFKLMKKSSESSYATSGSDKPKCRCGTSPNTGKCLTCTTADR